MFVVCGLMECVCGENGGEWRVGEEIGWCWGGGCDECGEDYYEWWKRSCEESNGLRGGVGCCEVKWSSGEMWLIFRLWLWLRGCEWEWEWERVGKGGEDGER